MSYESRDTKGQATSAAFDGTIRRDPRAKPKTVVAAFTGNNDLGFPHADVVKHVSTFQPDLLIFTGDQIYEPVGGFGVQRAPLDMATLDYLRKWFMYGWDTAICSATFPRSRCPTTTTSTTATSGAPAAATPTTSCRPCSAASAGRR